MNFTAFIDSLSYMLQGMVGIFIVMGIITGTISLLNKFFSK